MSRNVKGSKGQILVHVSHWRHWNCKRNHTAHHYFWCQSKGSGREITLQFNFAIVCLQYFAAAAHFLRVLITFFLTDSSKRLCTEGSHAWCVGLYCAQQCQSDTEAYVEVKNIQTCQCWLYPLCLYPDHKLHCPLMGESDPAAAHKLQRRNIYLDVHVYCTTTTVTFRASCSSSVWSIIWWRAWRLKPHLGGKSVKYLWEHSLVCMISCPLPSGWLDVMWYIYLDIGT